MAVTPLDDVVRRAARLSNVPGVTIAEACKRFGVKKTAVQKARRDHASEIRLSVEDLVISALTNTGLITSGNTRGLEHIASWIAYVNQDSCDGEEILAYIKGAAARGQFELAGENWKLIQPWP